ncbi:MAG: His/Gly/Thr/Pro-type tRNA ligase C-terminal domain-containing protein, partial [Acidimicrobiia bacterium]
TSWGVSTRLMGALVMAHGDDAGLRLPPRLAPIHVVILAVRSEGGVVERCVALKDELLAAGLRVELDDRTDVSFGRRAVEWELKGVPVRLEVGPRDLEAQTVTVVRRDTRDKASVSVSAVAPHVADTLETIQTAMFAEALELRRRRTIDVTSVESAEQAARDGFAVLPVDALGADGEQRLNTARASVRCIQRPDGSLPDAGDEHLVAVIARAY